MKHIRRSVKLSACASLAAIAVIVFSSGGTTAVASSGHALQTVTLSGDGYDLGAEALVGATKGFWAKQGLRPKVTTFATGVDGINAMIAGQVQFSFGLDFAAVSTATKHVAILGSVASPSTQGGYNQMYFAHGITSPQQLVGKQIGVLAGTDQEYLTYRWIQKHGLAGKVTTVNLPGLFELVGALKTGQIGAAFLYADAVTQAEQDSSLFHYGDDSGLIKVQGIYMLTLKTTARQHPQLVLNVLKAMRASAAWMKAHPATAGAILASKESGSTKSELANQLKLDDEGLGFTSAQKAGLLQIQVFLKSRHELGPGVSLQQSLDLGPLHQVLGSSK